MYATELPIRDNVAASHGAALEQISKPGAFWSAADRIAMVDEARASTDCQLCRQRKEALSPNAITGSHDSASQLPDAIVDMIHRIKSDPGRLTRSVLDGVLAAGFSQEQYIEVVSVVNASVIIDTMHRALDLSPPELPSATPGSATGQTPPDVVDAGAWVPIAAVGSTDPTATGLPSSPNIARSMGLVPSAVALFFTAFRSHYALADIPLSISQAQAEFVASRVSALNQCFY